MNLTLNITTLNNKKLNKSIHYRQDTIPIFINIYTDYINLNAGLNTFKLDLFNQHGNIPLHTYHTNDFNKLLYTSHQYNLNLNINGNDIITYFTNLKLELRDNQTKINYMFGANVGINQTMESGYFYIC